MNKFPLPLKSISPERTFVNIALQLIRSTIGVHFQSSIFHFHHALRRSPTVLHTMRHLEDIGSLAHDACHQLTKFHDIEIRFRSL